MPVNKEVFIPGMQKKVDPRDATPRTPTMWENEARDAEAQAKYELAKQKLEEIKDPNKRELTKPAFQVTGEVNLGKFDLQEQQRETQRQMQEIKDRMESQISEISQQADNYREQVHQLQLKAVQDSMALQLEQLNKQLLNGVNQKQPSFVEQLQQVRALAGELGYQVGGASSGSNDAALQLQILKMNNDAAREAREFEWKLKQYDLEREMRLMEVREKASIEKEKLNLERDRNNMLANGWEMLGSAMARGLMDGGAGIFGQPAGQPAAKSPQQQTTTDKSYKVQIYEGEVGQFPCPYCGTEIGVGPATQMAVCTACGKSMPVERQSRPAGQPDPMLAPEEADRNG